MDTAEATEGKMLHLSRNDLVTACGRRIKVKTLGPSQFLRAGVSMRCGTCYSVAISTLEKA